MMTEREWTGAMEARAANEAATRALRWARVSAALAVAILGLLIFQLLR